ncbi:nucleotidyltransferase family protein, partial [Deltaproteobacteria bacterium]|nr:nucleotidyltransferase family protein [Deltaproteobacteria bacterium]
LDNPKLQAVINPRYKEGMSGSLQCGLKEIKDEFPSIMIILGDQPFLDTGTINLLLHRFRSSERDICVPVYKESKGLPVCFSNKFYVDIMEITGDIGARHIIQKNPDHVFTAEIDNSDCFLDVDNKNDAAKLLSEFQKIIS